MIRPGTSLNFGIFCPSTPCDFLNQIKPEDQGTLIFCKACKYPITRPKLCRSEGVEATKQDEEEFTEMDKMKVEEAKLVEGELISPKGKQTNEVMEKELTEVTPIAHSTPLGDKRSSLNLRARAEQLDLDSVRRKLCLSAYGEEEDPADYFKFKEEGDDIVNQPGPTAKVKKIYDDLEQEETREAFPTTEKEEDPALLAVSDCINELVCQLDQPQHIKADAKKIFSEVMGSPTLVGHSTVAKAAACVFIACQYRRRFDFKKMCDVSGASKVQIGMCYHEMCKLLDYL
jgi:hypothetical protein